MFRTGQRNLSVILLQTRVQLWTTAAQRVCGGADPMKTSVGSGPSAPAVGNSHDEQEQEHAQDHGQSHRQLPPMELVQTVSSSVCLQDQHAFGFFQVSVVELWVYPKEVAHQWVNVHHVKGIHSEVLLEIRPHSSEEGLHVHDLIIKAVVSFVVVQR